MASSKNGLDEQLRTLSNRRVNLQTRGRAAHNIFRVCFRSFPIYFLWKNKHDYLTELVANFVKDVAMDSCQLLKRKPDTKDRYIRGTCPIPPEDAQYLYDHHDIVKFPKLYRMDESESYDNVLTLLNNNEISNNDPSTGCFELLENIFLDIINTSSTSRGTKEAEVDLKRMLFILTKSEEDGIHVIQFSRNREEGRYGFLNEVYNPEDQ